MELGLLYFMYDPRSEYQFETDEAVRLDIIKSQTGIGKNWKPNERFEAAIPVYKYLTITTSSIILETNRQSINTIREILLTPIGEIDESKKFDHAVKMAKTIKELNDLAEQIVKVEKEIHKEVEEQSAKLRGKGSHTIGDIGGAGDIFKGI